MDWACEDSVGSDVCEVCCQTVNIPSVGSVKTTNTVGNCGFGFATAHIGRVCFTVISVSSFKRIVKIHLSNCFTAHYELLVQNVAFLPWPLDNLFLDMVFIAGIWEWVIKVPGILSIREQSICKRHMYAAFTQRHIVVQALRGSRRPNWWCWLLLQGISRGVSGQDSRLSSYNKKVER